MEWYDYLITYSFEKDGALGLYNGSMQLSRKKKINSFEEVDATRKYLEEKNDGARNLMITNFIYLGRHKHNDY